MIVAIDIGTTKICVIVAQQRADGHYEVIAVGKAPSQGLARGIIVDLTSAAESMRVAVARAEAACGQKITSAYIGVSGSHIVATTSYGMVPIRSGTVEPYDIERVLTAARLIPLTEGQQILHVLPQEYILDGTTRVRDPRGMRALRLEVQAHIIVGSVASVQDLVRCCEMVGITARDVILEPLASAEAVLTPDERDLGIALLDIGGGTADFTIVADRSIRYTKIFPIAGNLFTSDVAHCLRIPHREAERIKHLYGCVWLPDHVGTTVTVERASGEGTEFISTDDLCLILESRALELLENVRATLAEYRPRPACGLVITGGGAELNGLESLARHILGIPVRIGAPRIPPGCPEELGHAMHATGYGLLLKACAREHEHGSAQGPLIQRVFWRMKSWVMDLL